MKRLRLTLVGQDDEDVLRQTGIVGLRRQRILRLTKEAEMQGSLLSYTDISGLLLTSAATLKRDINYLEKHGTIVLIKGRRGNGNGKGQ